MIGLGAGLLTMLLTMLFVIAPFAFVGFIVWTSLRKRQERLEQRAQVQKEIIGKFSSAAEMQEFLKTDAGMSFFKDLDPDGRRRFRNIREKAIARIGLGIVLIVVGTGLVILAHESDRPQVMTSYRVDPGTTNVPPPPAGPYLELPPGMELPAAAILLTGIGLVISALVMLKLHPAEQPKS